MRFSCEMSCDVMCAPATQNSIPKSKRNLPKTVEASFTVSDRFEHDPNVIRA